MLRISVIDSSESATTLRLEGELSGEWIAELHRSCAPALDAGRKLTLDFADVAFIDRIGLEFLVSLCRRAVIFTNCSPFQREQLRHAAGNSAPRP